MKPVLSAHNLSYSVGEARLLQDVNLDVNPGEVVGLIGPNGAGKSTLLRALIGFIRPEQGTVRLHGLPLSGYSARERSRQMSYLSRQGPDQFSFRARDVVEMGSYAGLRWGRSPGTREREAALHALEQVGLLKLADREFPTLSEGERQLVLFARILVQNAPVMLLDEPTANLDIGHEHTLLRMVRTLCDTGRSAVIALHNLNSAAEYCKRLVLIESGRITASGRPDNVLTRTHLERAYQTDVRIGQNETTGSITVNSIPGPGNRRNLKVHVIGGAGSAVGITRFLHRKGCTITGGVSHELDSDAKFWAALGIDFLQVPAFSEIGENTLTRAAGLVREADLTILCAFPFGHGNAANLDVAEQAHELLILDENAGLCRRAFFGDAAELERKFRRLAKTWDVVSYEEACDYINSLTSKVTVTVTRSGG